MKISIVTAVRNGEALIGETVESVLSQQGVELEYIIIDGASTDGTLAALAPWRNRIAKIISEPDSGVYQAMNKGIALATGEVIGLLNCGDRYYPGALALVARTFAAATDRRAVFWGDVQYEHLGRVRGFRPENLTRGAFAPHPSMFVPRQVYEEIGVYDESFSLLGDYDFMYRAVNVHHLAVLYVPELVAFYREGGMSDRRIVDCLRDELRVKIRYGQSKFWAKTLYYAKLIKNLPRILLANR